MLLEIKNLSKSYGKKEALINFSYTFENGVYAILGPNGAGKSTLINLISDNVTRQNGEILCDGKDILSLGRSYRMKIGLMPQSQGMYEQMTARQFLMYMAQLKGISKNDAKKQVNELLEVVNLSAVAHKRLGSFSGGMKQRALLAQALLGSPELLMLDEPTAGLDPEERVRLRNYISMLAQDKIVLITTHITSDVENIADKILIMKNGQLVCAQTIGELFESTGADGLEAAYIAALHKED